MQGLADQKEYPKMRSQKTKPSYFTVNGVMQQLGFDSGPKNIPQIIHTSFCNNFPDDFDDEDIS